MINWEITDKECVYAFLEKYYNIIAVIGNRDYLWKNKSDIIIKKHT